MFALPLVGWAMLGGRLPIVLYGWLRLPPIAPPTRAVFRAADHARALAFLLFATFIAHFSGAMMHALIFRDGVFEAWRHGRSKGVIDNVRPLHTIQTGPARACATFGVDENDLRDYRPRYNIAPTDQHFIVTSKYERRTARPANWGLVNAWATDNRRASQCVNAKAETLEERRTFREAFLERRCVVPADGFYEWRGPKTQREPVWLHPAAGGLLLFAGLYESWQPKPGEWQRTFTIITTIANAVLQPIHDRMPVILDERAAEDWMNPRDRDPLSLKRLLAPAPPDLLKCDPRHRS